MDDRLPPPHVNPAAPDLIKSGLLLRMNWGGMEGDLAMMHEAAAEWTGAAHIARIIRESSLILGISFSISRMHHVRHTILAYI